MGWSWLGCALPLPPFPAVIRISSGLGISPWVGMGGTQEKPWSLSVVTVGLQSLIVTLSTSALCWPGPSRSTRPTNSSFKQTEGKDCQLGAGSLQIPHLGLLSSPGMAGGVPQEEPSPLSSPRCCCLGPATPAPGSHSLPQPVPRSLTKGVCMGGSSDLVHHAGGPWGLGLGPGDI